jgi:uncharacterized protein (DUF736 family)
MEQKENSGVLFRNNKKETEKHPDYTGKCLVNGKEMFISSWINESKNGTKYMALKFQEPKAEGVPAAATAAQPSDDLPW